MRTSVSDGGHEARISIHGGLWTGAGEPFVSGKMGFASSSALVRRTLAGRICRPPMVVVFDYALLA